MGRSRPPARRRVGGGQALFGLNLNSKEGNRHFVDLESEAMDCEAGESVEGFCTKAAAAAASTTPQACLLSLVAGTHSANLVLSLNCCLFKVL